MNSNSTTGSPGGGLDIRALIKQHEGRNTNCTPPT